jgi:hypothetical protein
MVRAAAFVAVALCLASRLYAEPRAVEVPMPQEFADIFDDSPLGADVDFVNGQIVLTGAAQKSGGQAAQPDAAGDQILELIDGSQLHGTLVSLGKSEMVWKRNDTTEPLLFNPAEVRRLILAAPLGPKQAKSNATLKLAADAWLTGDLTAFAGGKFHLNLAGAGGIEIDRKQVEWLYLSGVAPPDSYEGPTGPMGLAGWDTGGFGTDGPWDYADGALLARANGPIARRFEFLPDKVDIEFTASDGGKSIRGLTLWIQPGEPSRGYSKGSLYLRFQATNFSANFHDGQNMKNFSASLPDEKGAPNLTHYRILLDRRDGRLILVVNGRQAADWDLPPIKNPSPGGSISWQPTYWTSNMAWTLSKVRVQPWDGDTAPDPRVAAGAKDLLSKHAAGRQIGILESIDAGSVRFSGTDFARNDDLFIRLARDAAADAPASVVARIWLAQRGEFDVQALGVRDGQIRVRTPFAGDLSLPVAAVRAIEFPHRLNALDQAAAEDSDTLIFQNGDRLRGSLASASHDRNVQWKPVKGDALVEFSIGRIAGIILSRPAPREDAAGRTAVRFRNGDWLTGDLILLDRKNVFLKSALAENLKLDRADLRTLYFASGGSVPVWDGAGDREIWMKGSGSAEYSGRSRKDDRSKRNAWRYMDGSFTLLGNGGRSGYGNGPNLGRSLEGLPDKVDISFELSTSSGPAGYAVQLFTEENRPGLMIQGSWDSAYIYDMSPRRQGGVFFNQPQQVDFGERIGSEGSRRHFRFLADRKTGRLAMIVNGELVGRFGQRAGKESAKPGRGIAIIPQPMSSRVTISNLWIAPWSGVLPPALAKSGKEPRPAGHPAPKQSKAAPGSKPPPEEPRNESAGEDVVALANGDETSGKVEGATPGQLRVACDVGTLEIPVERTLMVEFAGASAEPAQGIRLRLAGRGALTVASLSIADGKVRCHGSGVGDLNFPLSALSEVVFQPEKQPAPPQPAAGEHPIQLRGPVIINGGGGILELNGIQIDGGGGVIIKNR